MEQESNFININMEEINMHLILAIIMGIFVGGSAGYIGSLMITKRMALMGGALGHLTLPGITLAILYNFDVSIGAMLFLLFGITLIWILEQKTKLHIENLTAIVFSVSLSIAFLFLPKEKTSLALIGDISQISLTSTIFTIIIALIIFFTSRKLYSDLILIRISQDIAKSEGIKIRKNNFIYLTCISLMVALGVRIVGGLMTAALVAIPAATSTNLSKNLFQYSYISMAAGSFSCLMGIIAFKFTGIAAGPLIIISSGILFLISLFFRK